MKTRVMWKVEPELPTLPGEQEVPAEELETLRQKYTKTYHGTVIGTTYVPCRGIHAVVQCTDGKIRDVNIDQLRVPLDADID